MDDATVPHATVARVLFRAQSVGAVVAALLILAGLALPFVVTEPPRRRHPFNLDATERALIAASATVIAAAAFGLRSRMRVLAWCACIILGALVLLIVSGVADARWALLGFRPREMHLGMSLVLISAGAVLAIISGVAATSDRPPGWVITGLTGIPVGNVEADPDMTAGRRLVLLFGPSVVMVTMVLVILVLNGPPEAYEP